MDELIDAWPHEVTMRWIESVGRMMSLIDIDQINHRGRDCISLQYNTGTMDTKGLNINYYPWILGSCQDWQRAAESLQDICTLLNFFLFL